MARPTDPFTRLAGGTLALLALAGALLAAAAVGAGGAELAQAGRAALALGLIAAVPVGATAVLGGAPSRPRRTRD